MRKTGNAWPGKKEVGSGDRQGRSGDVETREGRDIRRKVVRVGTPLHKSSNPFAGGKIRLRAKIHFSISPTLENFLEIQKFEKKIAK